MQVGMCMRPGSSRFFRTVAQNSLSFCVWSDAIEVPVNKPSNFADTAICVARRFRDGALSFVARRRFPSMFDLALGLLRPACSLMQHYPPSDRDTTSQVLSRNPDCEHAFSFSSS